MTRSPEELTAVIERICSKADWFRSVWFHVNGYPVLICRREPTDEEKKSARAEFDRAGIAAFDYRVIPEQTLRDQIYTPDLRPGQLLRYSVDGTVTWEDESELMPPDVSFDPLTGALTIKEGSAVKRVVVPDGTEVTVPGEGVLHVIYKGNKTIHIHRS